MFAWYNNQKNLRKQWTTLNNGYLGSRNDEERSEMRYVMRIAEFSESSNLWTQIALSGITGEYISQKRQELIIALAKQSADYYHENKGERIGPGDHWQEFIQTYNARSQDYSDYEFKDGEPNYLFMRYFAEKIQQAMTAADEKWIVQQMCEIQAPKAFKALNKSVKELVSVQQIVSTAEKIQQKKNKVPRSKRQTTRQDIDYKNESSSDHII